MQFGFVGVSTFAHLKHVKCLTSPDESFDVAVIGNPFDTAVSYRPGKDFALEVFLRQTHAATLSVLNLEC